MRTSDFDYDLPPSLIAQQPVEPRDAARLLVVSRGSGLLAHHHVRDLPDLLNRGDLLVLNDTRVMAGRLRGFRADTGGQVEFLLLFEHDNGSWSALVRPARGAIPGRQYRLEGSDGPLTGTVLHREDEIATVAFDRPIDPASVGTVPLPPYIRDFVGDPERYQTVYAREARSAAAPTAGLHFSEELFSRLTTVGVDHTFLTLEVGAGTFRPVRAEDPAEHVLGPERFSLPSGAAKAIRSARADGRRVIAIGTTVVRTLEHAFADQDAVLEGETDLFIRPGYTFSTVDALLTNFHLPRSTLLMLVSAFGGYDLIRSAYAEAIRESYRFYSFGDAMLLLP
ncbi:MAG: tRNA preQ1(34) S-adenosylmethionine ribosyltransferase-isomerase QueA [Dehalococcoidia bacterium]|nr:tRNA preQ1(34) S-adenosylmethionine ribosyltransferase-isomerase QueA [Dehalococcoidia bacterium]HCV00217.1 tRNA preQ1(34) S-adenosylmethionine ribosyltransferase-isomerase QueA [Dehalococcoidia bacterium]